MAITLSTKAFEERHKKKPTGSHYWRFVGSGETTGRRKAKRLHLTVETDGPFPKAREAALESFRKAFGSNAEITVEVMP